MIGAIAGDIIGSVYEFNQTKNYDFPLLSPGSNYTDDTILTIAVAKAILTDRDYLSSIKYFGNSYPFGGYGSFFSQWLISGSSTPYNSWGNGSAMRVSPVGFAFNTKKEVLDEAKKSAEITHNHPEGVKGAQATALAIFMAKNGESNDIIRQKLSDYFDYDLTRTLDEIRPDYFFNESCQKTVPEAITAFLESVDFEDAIRKAVSLGGDSDTLGCITGGIAQAYYKKIPSEIENFVYNCIPVEFIKIVDEFNQKFNVKY